jgi:hypothetical protein
MVTDPLTLVLPDGRTLGRSKLMPSDDLAASSIAQVFDLGPRGDRATPLLLHLEHHHPALLRVRLLARESWHAEERSALALLSALYAALAAFALIAACYWAVLRDRMFGDYTLYLVTLVCFLASNSGVLYACRAARLRGARYPRAVGAGDGRARFRAGLRQPLRRRRAPRTATGRVVRTLARPAARGRGGRGAAAVARGLARARHQRAAAGIQPDAGRARRGGGARGQPLRRVFPGGLDSAALLHFAARRADRRAVPAMARARPVVRRRRGVGGDGADARHRRPRARVPARARPGAARGRARPV